ncbi:hypothetical protein PTTG_04524 [Puccinia triticina 1-1 BBBD Race 1]|uniref:Galactose oxidase-like Early set domain-containing protein n=1 Tax=Puccinia triticina (isolate 1-1 / race 1 (BBBD)) TaxID=630390 RepID=A0A180H336_PUCT1|nr:hypothetical protein PTTG_04524 [Puccinia triticina 1-1 BBBD Race 1]
MIAITTRHSFCLIYLAVASICLFLDPRRAGTNAHSVNTPEEPDPFGIRDKTNGRWSRIVKGHTGVAAMQISVVSDKYALILDKVENNPLKINGHRAWAALYNFETDAVTPIDLKSNSFCAGGSFLGNGTLINFGGNPVGRPKPGDFGPTNGLQSIRFYTPCDDGKCTVAEYDSIKLTSARWYATAARLADGTIMIVGGKILPKSTTRRSNTSHHDSFHLRLILKKTQIHSPFLDRTLVANLFPIVITLPKPGLVFMAANRDAIIYDYTTNRETRLPRIPNGVRVTYPMTGGGILLPLSPHNDYQPEVLICGGSDLNDALETKLIKATAPATTQCVRMVLTEAGIKEGWQVEHMPQGRIMPDMITMPDGTILIVNGAQTGVGGFGSLEKMTGNSNAENPSFTPVLYHPDAPAGKRFSTEGLPTTNIARLYHSVATLTPSGQVMLAGSNPNPDVTTNNYRTEYRVEWLSPPYIKDPHRPTISSLPKIANYKEKIKVKLDDMDIKLAEQHVEAVLLDFGFVTHSTHMNSRLVKLITKFDSPANKLKVVMPPSPEIYPPGYAWLFVLVNGIPSPGKRIMVGSGKLLI